MNRNRHKFTPSLNDAPSATRACDHPGCAGEGQYRAPKSRDRLTEYYWFCLDHVREYNKAWDFYAGMSEKQIEDQIRRDTTWQRPTWRMGQWRVQEKFIRDRLRDDFAFGMNGFTFGDGGSATAGGPAMRTPEEEALALLDLQPPVDFARIKSRYRELVKLHHPDANGGDKAAEERLKVINQAYNTLKTSYGTYREAPAPPDAPSRRRTAK